jgi:polyvinyl alcohol dehydrogenase (cytochrome)
VFGIMSGPDGPYAVALDRLTGRVVWRSAIIDTHPGDYSNASAVVYRGLLFVGFSSPEGDQDSRGGFALLDTATGRILKRTYVVPDKQFRQGYGGAGIWSTPAIDAAASYAYVGVGNPYTTNKEYKYTNAIVKIDLDRSRSTFGTIVDGMKGNVDQYYPEATALADTPVCEQAPLPADLDRPWCGQLDLDFGAAPNLYRDAAGHLLVADQQKAGVEHVADTADMQEAWSAVVGLPCQVCNAEATAFDGKRLYVVGTPGGFLWALDPNTGQYDWVAPVADGIHYEAVTVAGGVVYTADTKGTIDLYDAATGVPLGQRPMSADTGSDACVALSGGVTVAEGSIFATCDEGAQGGGWIVAYD